MFDIPQEEIDKISNEPGFDDINDEHAEVEEEVETPEESKEQVSESTDEDSVADKARVPYSRFETVNERAIRAEERLKILEEQLASSGKAESTAELELPSEWIELYGDSDEAKRAYQLQLTMLDKTREEATKKILESIEKKQSEKEQAIEENIKVIDEGLAELSNNIGRKLTEAEESAVLDIQDEFTPKDDNGNYVAPLLSPEKAFEIYNLRQSSAKADKVIARRKVLSVTGADTEGEGSNSAFENYRPGVSGLWRDKL